MSTRHGAETATGLSSSAFCQLKEFSEDSLSQERIRCFALKAATDSLSQELDQRWKAPPEAQDQGARIPLSEAYFLYAAATAG
jgi:hypothetical protein